MISAHHFDLLWLALWAYIMSQFLPCMKDGIEKTSIASIMVLASGMMIVMDLWSIIDRFIKYGWPQ